MSSFAVEYNSTVLIFWAPWTLGNYIPQIKSLKNVLKVTEEAIPFLLS